VDEYWIDTPKGRVFAARWAPDGAGGGRAPIVLLHDSLGCVTLWRDFPAQLSEITGRQVVAYDRLGFGRSDPYPGRLPLSFVSDEADGAFAALRRRLGLERFVLFGHSVGGGMGVEAAGRYPEACEALVTVSAQAFVEDRTLDGIRAAKQAFDDEGQMDRLRRYHGDKAQWVLDAWTGTWLSQAFRDWSLDAALPRVACPTLAIHGELDEYASNRHPERIAALTAGTAEAEIIADCGHIPHREQPETVIGMVVEFLSGTSARP
jgi:pimeloyl-ACP methyl ester carboxylesterase